MTSTIWSRLCLHWSRLVFGDKIIMLTPKVRAMRLLEEAIELAQAEEVTISELQTIAEQVYSKPRGYPYDELGGVLITLAAYAGTRGYNIDNCFLDEFERIMDPKIMERVRTRNLSGDKIGFDPPPKPAPSKGFNR